MREETAELENARRSGDQQKVEEELGDLLFAAVNVARFLHMDPEIALKKANAKFSKRFHTMEGIARKSGRAFQDLPREQMEALWDATKEGNPKQPLVELGQAQVRR